MNKILTIIIFLYFGIILNAQKGTLKIIITDIESDKGNIKTALYNESQKQWFLKSVSKADCLKEVTIKNNKATVIFTDVPYGTYAISLFHDKNNNGEFDRTSVGFPDEPYGISGNKLTIGPPKFKDSKFKFNSSEKLLYIKMKTFL